jgi:AcrR family transcriptional regulator
MPYPAKTDRQTILTAAIEQLQAHGLAGLSIRSLAASLELAPNALYRYFPDRLQLEIAMGDEVAARLHTLLRRVIHKKAPEQAIRAIAAAYLKFAREQRPLYDMMMTSCPSPASQQSHGAGREALWLFVIEQVVPIAGESHAREAATAIWAFLHGMTALEAAGVLGDEKPRSSFDFGLNAWFEGAARARERSQQHP